MSSKTRYVILGLLTEGPLSGYQLKKLIDLRFRFFWNESFGQIYPELKRLQFEGLIEKNNQDDSVTKNLYRCTDLGVIALQDWMKQDVETESYRLEILLKMYFASIDKPEWMIKHLKTFKTQHERDLALLQQFDKELKLIDHPNHIDILSVVQFGLLSNQAYLKWVDETLKRLEKKDEQKK